MRKQEMDIDYLAPFLAKIGNPEKLSKQQAFSLKEECLADLKQRLIDKANLIQARFEKVCAQSVIILLIIHDMIYILKSLPSL